MKMMVCCIRSRSIPHTIAEVVVDGLLYPNASHIGKAVSVTAYGIGTLAYFGKLIA
jgi:hypothetical protein